MSAKVQGQRSPRWAFMRRMTIPCLDGTDYLVRLRIVQTPWFGVYLHDIHKDDSDRAPHNHPWAFLSIVLRGRYVERLYPDPLKLPDGFRVQRHDRFSIHRMGRSSAHRITFATPGLKTLIVTGRRAASWGFFENGVYSDWSEYERKIGTLEPARMGTEKHAILGQRTITRRAAIVADACAACAAKPDGVPGKLRKDPRTVSFRDDLQTTIFDHMEP